MPKKVIKKIEEEYEDKGKAPKVAKRIAYATANKEGLLKDRKPRASRKKKK